MNMPASSFGPSAKDLCALFPSAEELFAGAIVQPNDVPEPYRELLVHSHHMTVTVENHHGSLVDVRILERRQDQDAYSRKILLVLQSTGRVVQFGIARVRLRYCSPDVRAAIVAGEKPLGRILIEHDVLRRVEPTAFLQVTPGREMTAWFGLDQPRTTYGRLAIIYCDGQPAVEVLEIVAPEYSVNSGSMGPRNVV
jgi:chorismate-pyruvate lyase